MLNMMLIVMMLEAQERQISPHEQLYQEATRRLQRRAEYEAVLPDAYTFAPRIIERPPDSCNLLDDDCAGTRKGGAALAERCVHPS